MCLSVYVPLSEKHIKCVCVHACVERGTGRRGRQVRGREAKGKEKREIRDSGQESRL